MTKTVTFREQLLFGLADLNVSKLAVDKDAEYQGDAATKISFVMTDPVGLHTGPLSFEVWFTDKIHLSNDKMIELTRINAERQANAFLFDKEVETV